MQEPMLRKIFLAFMQIHILQHAGKAPIYGSWMMEELKHHGYDISAGTLYPMFHQLEKDGLLAMQQEVVGGKVRKYYRLTERGAVVLKEAKAKIQELTGEVEA